MSNGYDYQSYLYPAGSAASGGGAGSGTGTAAPAKPLQIGTVETLPEGSAATATLEETVTNTVLNLGIPQGTHGAKGDKGDTGDTGAAASNGAVVGVSVGARTLMFPKYQHKYIPRPSVMKNNEWYTIKFDSTFDSTTDTVHLQVTPVMSGYRSFLVNNVTAEGFDIMCNYVPELVGLYYTAYADVLG